MTKAKIQIGAKVFKNNCEGTISRIITKSTGYVEVTFVNGQVKKEMAINLIDENGQPMKNKSVSKPLTDAQRESNQRDINRFQAQMKQAIYLDTHF
jgi:hypothetical protein